MIKFWVNQSYINKKCKFYNNFVNILLSESVGSSSPLIYKEIISFRSLINFAMNSGYVSLEVISPANPLDEVKG
jgi:hypothetical protein